MPEFFVIRTHPDVQQNLWLPSLRRNRELEARTQVATLEAVSIEPELDAKRWANRHHEFPTRIERRQKMFLSALDLSLLGLWKKLEPIQIVIDIWLAVPWPDPIFR